jgi:alpha-galactosidase
MIRQALERNNPDNDFILSLCLWGAADVRSWARDYGEHIADQRRYLPDLGAYAGHNMDTAIRRPLYAHPGSWNDPDMLLHRHG